MIDMADCAVCTKEGAPEEDRPVTTFQYVRIKSLADQDYPEEEQQKAVFVGLVHTPDEIQAAVVEAGLPGPFKLLWHAPQQVQVGVTLFHPDGQIGLQRLDVEDAAGIADAIRAARWPAKKREAV